MTVAFTKLTAFPRNRLLEDELAHGRVRELDLLARFGPPSHETPASEPDPTFFWDLEWACGLVMGLQFDQLTEQLVLRLDEPEIDHALRHLGVEVRDLWSIDADTARRLDRTDPAEQGSWGLWREDRNELKERVAAGLCRRDADCRAAELAPGDPAHRYWVAPDDS